MDMHPSLRRACLGCRFPLEVAAVARCPECGQGFDPSDSSTYGVRLDKPVVLTVVQSAVDAELLRARLADEGVMAACETVRALSWGLDMREVGCRVHVDASDLEAAQRIMAPELTTPTTPLDGMDGVDDGPVEQPQLSWTCGACGEEIEGVFALCWSCGAPRSEDGETSQPRVRATRDNELTSASMTEHRRLNRRPLEAIGVAGLAIVAIRTAFGTVSPMDLFIGAVGIACLVPAARRWWRRRGERRARRAALREQDGSAPME